jgi:nitrogen fixation protein FixH
MTNTKSSPKAIIIGIILLATVFLTGLFVALNISFSTPIEMADDYQMGYQELEKKYDDIMNKQKLFDEKYESSVESDTEFAMHGNSVAVRVVDKSGRSVDNANVTAYITRPDTTKLNINLPKFRYEHGRYASSAFDLPKEGRWLVCVKVQIGDTVKYINFERWAEKTL